MTFAITRSLRRLHSLSRDLLEPDVLRDYQRDERNALQPNNHGLLFRIWDSLSRTWDLGFTAFGGPAVHVRIFHARFVEGEGGKVPWVDEQTYQELFAICQALPGPASTKMLFCLIMLHAGLIPAICGFTLWCLPGAVSMYALSLGVANIGVTLPAPIYALLSGLNAAIVGTIALAATQLASRTIVDRLTRILVIAGACAGVCYSALWYFPVIMVVGGSSVVVWDVWLSRLIGKYRARMAQTRRQATAEPETGTTVPADVISMAMAPIGPTAQSRDSPPPSNSARSTIHAASFQASEPQRPLYTISRWQGIAIIAAFFATFITSTTALLLSHPPLLPSLFSNLYLAGTIIFGGGPVVIPLLRTYIVDPGWVAPRDFLLGLAIIQALPGPNFNFAIYLGALAVKQTSTHSIVGALVAGVGMYTPGLVLAVGVQGLWTFLRTKPAVISMLRGVNATAVGLIFTAVYRLWEIGYLTAERGSGGSLGKEAWWVVVATVAYASGAWFGIPAAVAIGCGGVAGVAWWGVTGG